MARSLVAFFKQHRHHFKSPAEITIDWRNVKRACTVREFDEAVILPIFGYPSSDAYYEDASVGPKLGRISVPTLLINALDDPICDTSLMPLEAVCKNPHIVAAVTTEGGHVAWSTGWWPTGRSWDNDVTVEWFGAFLSARCVADANAKREPVVASVRPEPEPLPSAFQNYTPQPPCPRL